MLTNLKERRQEDDMTVDIAKTYDTYLETEEFITAEEYLRRRKKGEINPKKTRIVPPDIRTGSFGGFAIKLDMPRYRPAFGEKAVRGVF